MEWGNLRTTARFFSLNPHAGLLADLETFSSPAESGSSVGDVLEIVLVWPLKASKGWMKLGFSKITLEPKLMSFCGKYSLKIELVWVWTGSLAAVIENLQGNYQLGGKIEKVCIYPLSDYCWVTLQKR